nr:unnamed protein product [Callosobruchus analis]
MRKPVNLFDFYPMKSSERPLKCADAKTQMPLGRSLYGLLSYAELYVSKLKTSQQQVSTTGRSGTHFSSADAIECAKPVENGCETCPESKRYAQSFGCAYLLLRFHTTTANELTCLLAAVQKAQKFLESNKPFYQTREMIEKWLLAALTKNHAEGITSRISETSRKTD